MRLYQILFSPTGGTKKAAAPFAEVFGREVSTIDLTDASMDFSQISLDKEDICVVAVPSFGGRVPAIAAERLERIRANGAMAILVVVYGNRTYDDTLLELKTRLKRAGFRCAAAVAAVAEHSIMRQFATGRPDPDDLAELSRFAKEIRRCLEEGRIPDDLAVPGNDPFREYSGIPIKPSAKKNCTNCGLCAKQCPVQAIPAADHSKTDHKTCISCMRCVSICPAHARSINPILTAVAAGKMKKICSVPKKNGLFLGE